MQLPVHEIEIRLPRATATSAEAAKQARERSGEACAVVIRGQVSGAEIVYGVLTGPSQELCQSAIELRRMAEKR